MLLLEVATLRCGKCREHKEVRKEKKRRKKLSLGIFYFLVSSMVDPANRRFYQEVKIAHKWRENKARWPEKKND